MQTSKLLEITGQTTTHLLNNPQIGVALHQKAVNAFLNLQHKAEIAGFKLKALSGFRSFEQQLNIWNAKAQGKRVLLDSAGLPLDFESLNPKEIVMSILRWSALPGMSRHHWGTDVDVIDEYGLPSHDYKVELTPQEVAPEGIFGPFHLWLDELIEQGESCGFYRPYAEDLGGVAPEKWHLSFAPQSLIYEQYLDEANFANFLATNHLLDQLELKSEVMELQAIIFERFVKNTSIVPFDIADLR